MENLSKIFSLVAGIFVVIIIFVILQNKYNLRGRFAWLGGSQTKQVPTPTPTPQKMTVLKTIEKIQPAPQSKNNQPNFTKGGGNIKTIPSTGPTLLIPLAFSGLFGGLYLRKKK